MSKVLVTGGAGFTGSHTVDELVKRGYEGVDNLEIQVHQGDCPPTLTIKLGSSRAISDSENIG